MDSPSTSVVDGRHRYFEYSRIGAVAKSATSVLFAHPLVDAAACLFAGSLGLVLVATAGNLSGAFLRDGTAANRVFGLQAQVVLAAWLAAVVILGFEKIGLTKAVLGSKTSPIKSEGVAQAASALSVVFALGLLAYAGEGGTNCAMGNPCGTTQPQPSPTQGCAGTRLPAARSSAWPALP